VPGAGHYEPPSLAALEQKLDKAPAHPCRTELLDDLLDKSPLSTVGRAAIADDVEQCVHTAAEAPSLRAQLKPGALQEPTLQKAKKRQKQKNLDAVHIAELEHRGQLALSVGEYGAAKELFASALQMEPDHVDDHALIAQALRGLGDPAGAGYHLRLWLWARPDSPEAERAVRYLKRYNQQTELHPSTTPAVDERHARAARLLHDAEVATDPIPSLEQARELLPADARVLWRLGDAYAKAGRGDEARRALKAALADANPHEARAIRDHLSKLGS
jgi:tetratricopeptide (TPR) repeat protein